VEIPPNWKKLFESAIPESERARFGNLMMVGARLLAALCVWGITAFLWLWVQGEPFFLPLFVGLFLLSMILLSHEMVRRDRFSLAAHLLVFALFVTQSVLLLYSGVSTAGLIMLLLPALVAEVVLNRRMTIVYVVAVLAVFVVVVALGLDVGLDWAKAMEALFTLIFVVMMVALVNQEISVSLQRQRLLNQQLESNSKTLTEDIARRTSELDALNAELRRSEARYRSLVELSPDGILVHNEDGILFINQAGCVMLGGTPPDFLGKSMVEMVSPPFRERAMARRQAVWEGQILVGVDGQWLRPDGSLLDVEISSGPVEFAGKPSMQIIFRDVAQRIATEAALRSSEAEKTALLNALPDAMFVFDPDLICLDYRPVPGEPQTHPTEAFPGQSIYQMLPPSVAATAAASIRMALADGTVQSFEYTLDQPDKTHFYEAKISPLADRSFVVILSRDITRQREAQNILANTERIYREAIAAAGGVPYQVDTVKQIYTFMGEGIEAVTGYRADEITQTFLRNRFEEYIFRGLLVGMTYAEAKHAVRSGAVPTWTVDIRFRTKNGESRWLSDTSVVIRDDSGASVGSVGFLMDITERKALEDELRQAQAHADAERNLLRTLIDNLPDSVYVKDTNAVFLVANRHAQQLVNAPDELSLIGKTDYDLFPAEFADRYFADDMAVIQSGQPILERIEQTLGPQKQTIWTLTNKIPVKSPGGEVIGLVGVGRDITPLKEAQDALIQTEAIYRRAIAAAGGVPYQLDTVAGTFTFMGDGIERLTGYSAAELDPQHWSELIEEYHLLGNLAGMSHKQAEQAVRSGAVPAWTEDVRIRTKSGESRWVSDSSVEIRDASGISTGSIGFLVDISNRKKMEEELRQAQATANAERNLLRTLIDNLPDGVYVKDVNAAYLAANRYSQQAINIPDESMMIGKTDYDFFPAELADVYFADDMAVIKSGQPILGRIEKIYAADGRIAWVYTSKIPVKNADGQVVALVGLGRDITQLKEAQDRLIETERIYRQSIAAAGGVPYQVDTTKQNYTFMGDGIEAITGYSADEFTQVFWRGLIEEHILRGPLAGMTRSQASHAVRSAAVPSWTEDVRIRTKSGENRWVSDTSVEIRDANGACVGAVGFLIDITDRKRIEMALQESETLFRTLFEESPEAIFLVDPNTLDGESCIVDCNAAACAMNGYSRQELVGQPISILNVNEHDRAEFLKRIRAHGSIHLDVLHRRKDGTVFAIETSSNIVSVNGRELIIGFDRDITERKMMENELRLAKDAAEAASRAKSEFLANMSHEIRTPMNAVMGMTSLLRDTSLTEEQLDCVETIRSSSDHLLAVINNILDFSKIESGKLELESISFNLRECVDTSMELFANETTHKGLHFSSLIEADVPTTVVGDPTRLRQVLTNLIGNAIKFTHKGEVVVSVASESVEKDRTRLHFQVRDTGIGIPEEKLDILFKSFSQVDASMTRKYGGTGLGLAISRHICEAMGGDMWVESTPGVGSTFHFTILVALPVAQTKVVSVVRYTANHEPVAEQIPLRILLAEDNLVNQKVAGRLLEKLGHRVDVAANGIEVLDALRRQPYNLILMDMQMPEMDGLEATRRIRSEWPADEQPRIVALTAHAHEEAYQMCVASGMDDYVTKPVRLDELAAALRRASAGLVTTGVAGVALPASPAGS